MSIPEKSPTKSIYRKFLNYVVEWFKYDDEGEWLKDMKSSISLTASIIATMTFSLATNPPGGVVQAGLSDTKRCSRLIMKGAVAPICVGEAILASFHHDDYLAFLVCNTICFISSLSVILLLVSGIPTNRFVVWLLSIILFITLSSLALTYLFAAFMVTPNSIWNSVSGNAFGIAPIVWASIVVIIVGLLIVRLIVRKTKILQPKI